MSNHSQSLAEISAAILSYNSDPAMERQNRAVEQDQATDEKRPDVQVVSAGRMRRHDDRLGPGYWPNR
jgi:hypothetical protein